MNFGGGTVINGNPVIPGDGQQNPSLFRAGRDQNGGGRVGHAVAPLFQCESDFMCRERKAVLKLDNLNPNAQRLTFNS